MPIRDAPVQSNWVSNRLGPSSPSPDWNWCIPNAKPFRAHVKPCSSLIGLEWTHKNDMEFFYQ